MIIDMVDQCEREGIRARIVPDFFRIIRSRAELENTGDVHLIAIRTEPFCLLKNRVLKRSFDIVFSLTVLVLLSPLFLFLAILIKATSRSTVFFKQERIGANNVKFDMYKFRSMTVQQMENWSFWLDMKIIWLTVFGRDTQKNVY